MNRYGAAGVGIASAVASTDMLPVMAQLAASRLRGKARQADNTGFSLFDLT